MPIISTFNGIVVRMNFGDHNPPHFHVEYQGYHAAFEIKSARLVAGELPGNAKKLVEAWAKKNRSALEANWQLAVQRQPIERIPGME